MEAGDPIAVKVNVRGTGNMNGVGEPVRPAGNAFKFYDPKATVNAGNTNGRIGGEKTFEYVAIPDRRATRESVRSYCPISTRRKIVTIPREHGRFR